MPIPQDARHLANQAGDFAVQHQNNWLIEVAGLDGDDKELIGLSLLSSSLPQEANNIVVLPYGNEERKVAGRATFEDVPLIVRDFVDRDIRGALIRWRRQVYDSRTGLIGLPSTYKKNAELIIQATNNTLFRAVRLIGVWPSAMNPGELNMESDDPVQIEMTLTLDRSEWLL